MLPFVAQHNADIGEIVPCLVAEPKARAPREFAKAYAGLPEQAQKYVCIECC
jgi:hypothetical protein